MQEPSGVSFTPRNCNSVPSARRPIQPSVPPTADAEFTTSPFKRTTSSPASSRTIM